MKAILCMDLDGNIGNNGKLLFDMKKDKKLFQDYTKNKVVIMGRKTYDCTPSLKNRKTVIMTKNKHFKVHDSSVDVVHSFNDIKKLFKKYSNFKQEDFVVIGGAQIYNLLIPYCDEVMVTKVLTHSKQPCDSRINMNLLKSFNNKAISIPYENIDRLNNKHIRVIYEQYIR